jgi:hypothetical protein
MDPRIVPHDKMPVGKIKIKINIFENNKNKIYNKIYK